MRIHTLDKYKCSQNGSYPGGQTEEEWQESLDDYDKKLDEKLEHLHF